MQVTIPQSVKSVPYPNHNTFLLSFFFFQFAYTVIPEQLYVLLLCFQTLLLFLIYNFYILFYILFTDDLFRMSVNIVCSQFPSLHTHTHTMCNQYALQRRQSSSKAVTAKSVIPTSVLHQAHRAKTQVYRTPGLYMSEPHHPQKSSE